MCPAIAVASRYGSLKKLQTRMIDRPEKSQAIAARSIRKAFGGVPVLEGISFDIRCGEVHTLMGENGAGKSTLMNILAGVHRPDGGTVELFGSPVSLTSPHVALAAGIALIHQEPQNFPDLSIAENLFLGRGVPRGAIRQIHWREMNRRTAEVLASLGVSLDPRRRMSGLSIADQQMVELAGALAQNAKVLLMDEPTAALTPSEVDRLFAIVRKLRDSGVAIVFISHRIPEVFEIADRITVLRDGHCIGTREVKQTDKNEIVRMMVGRPLGEMYEKPDSTPGEVMLRVNDLTSGTRFSGINLTVRAGEIVGIAGLVGAGRTEVAEAIFGIRKRDRGSVEVGGKSVSIRSPRDAIQNGIAYVPEDRARNGLLLPMSIANNTTLASLPSVSAFGFISGAREAAMAESWRGTLKTRLREVSQPVNELSGGNQQKVVLARWLETKPKVLIVDEPTRGIDVGAKAEVHHVLAELARQGTAILMISSDLPEVIAMSDRVLVMKEGRLTGEFARGAATQEAVMRAATVGDESVRGGDSQLATSRVAKRRATSLLTDFREWGVFAFVVLVFGLLTAKDARFASPDTLRSILFAMPLIVIVACGQLLAILSRNIDLSVGSMLGLSAIIAGGMFVSHPGFPVSGAIAFSVAIGALLGFVNGGLVAWLRVPAIIATLGTLTAYRGLVYIWSGGKQVAKDSLPPALSTLAQQGPIGIPWFAWIAAAVAIAMALFLKFTATGRNIYAIGSNPRAAQLRGIPVRGTILTVFTLSGACAGLAGILYGARFGTINPADAGAKPPMELIVISAVVLGGAAVNGGAGSVFGTVLGCLLLAMVDAATSILSISLFWQRVFYGGAILLAITADSLMRRKGRAS
jgi:ABC-type sugar transport system ATPase subunit/ribose/xylose/arabinose/galactoside ABC-type transport system permease subunit